MPSVAKAITAATVLVLLPLAQAQESAPSREYWVSIASFQEFENAEIAQNQASERLKERLSITPATTPSGYVLRVVAGPYFDREMADQMLESSRQAGYDTAWIFSQAVPEIAAPGVAEDFTSAAALSSSAALSSGSTFPSSGPSSGSDSPPVPRADFMPAPADPARNDPVLVEQAPASYSVHRLYRD